MRTFALRFATTFLFACAAAPAYAGNIYGISYTDISPTSSTNLTTAGTLDWVKWGNGDPNDTVNYMTSQMNGGTTINPALTPLGGGGGTVQLAAFEPLTTSSPSFSWTNGTNPESGGVPVGTSVSEQMDQNSYPLGLGLSFQVAASASPEVLSLYVVGFNAQMEVSASLSGGGSTSLTASNAALVNVQADGTSNYYSYGIFSMVYSGAGETLTVNLTTANQTGVPLDATQYTFPNAGVFAATVNAASVPEPSSLVLSGIGLGGLLGYGFVRRRTK